MAQLSALNQIIPIREENPSFVGVSLPETLSILVQFLCNQMALDMSVLDRLCIGEIGEALQNIGSIFVGLQDVLLSGNVSATLDLDDVESAADRHTEKVDAVVVPLAAFGLQPKF